VKSPDEIERRTLLQTTVTAAAMWPIANAMGAEPASPLALPEANNETAPFRSPWRCAVELDSQRNVTAGSNAALADAIRRGADLQVQTEFIHNEHIDTSSDSRELIREAAEFRTAYLLEDRAVAGIMTLRQPISLPDGFGPRPSMSFFMYNQGGQQAVARPFLDGPPAKCTPGPSPLDDHSDMPKYHQQDGFDSDTNAPSSNFIYDFNVFRYLVRDDWKELLSHRADGSVVSGSVDTLADAFTRGCELKVAIRGLCADLSGDAGPPVDHELYVHIGSAYYYSAQKLFIAGTHPTVRVRPAVPLRYVSKGWDFGWLMPRSDGYCAQLLTDPYTLQFRRGNGHYAIRWFAR